LGFPLAHTAFTDGAGNNILQAKLKYWQKQCELLQVDLIDLQATERKEEAKSRGSGTFGPLPT
jgi:hypothetical protein